MSSTTTATPTKTEFTKGDENKNTTNMTSPLERAEEKAFLNRLNDFMVENPSLYPKLIWMGMRDGKFHKFKLKNLICPF